MKPTARDAMIASVFATVPAVAYLFLVRRMKRFLQITYD